MTSSKSYSLCLHICYYIDYTDFVVWFLGDVGWSLCFCFTQAPMARNAQNERKCNFIFPVGLYGCKLHFNLSATLIPKARADNISLSNLWRRQLKKALFPTHLSSPGMKLCCQLHEPFLCIDGYNFYVFIYIYKIKIMQANGIILVRSYFWGLNLAILDFS